jgi:hypothetical protein
MTDTDLATLEDAARAEGQAKGVMLAYDVLRAAGHEDLANQAADLANELLALAARIRRQGRRIWSRSRSTDDNGRRGATPRRPKLSQQSGLLVASRPSFHPEATTWGAGSAGASWPEHRKDGGTSAAVRRTSAPPIWLRPNLIATGPVSVDHGAARSGTPELAGPPGCPISRPTQACPRTRRPLGAAPGGKQSRRA